MKAKDLHNIPDVQATPDARKLAIDKVGIKTIRHPIKVAEKGGGVQHTIATFNMYVGLPHHFKGTHMSRFVEILNAHERELSVDSFKAMLKEMVQRLEAEEGRIEMAFPYFIEKQAPVSGVKGLMGLRGWGLAPPAPDNAVDQARTPVFDRLMAEYPSATLRTSGRDVGLPDGQMGNNEVGHLTIGAGRILYQELVRITRSMETGEFGQRQAWRDFARRGVEKSGRLHLIGLVSDGGVHSHQDHLVSIVAQAKQDGFPEICIHVLLDGRDTDPPNSDTRNLSALIARLWCTPDTD